MTQEIEDAITSLQQNLTYPELQKLIKHQAKLVVIDNHAWYIDMEGADKNGIASKGR